MYWRSAKVAPTLPDWLPRPLRWRRSIAGRLALMFAGVAVAVFAVTGVALHHVLARELDRYQAEQLQGHLEDIRYMLVHGRSQRLLQHAKEKMDELSSADGHTRYWLWSDDPAWRHGDDARGMADAALASAGMVIVPQQPGTQRMSVLGTRVAANDIRPAVVLVAGMDMQGIAHALNTFESALIVLTVLGSALVAGLGYWVAVAGLRPVQQLSQEAQRIGPDSRGERLRLPALPMELMDMGASFNAALDRLNAAYQQLETFNADVAHELRTPVANLIGQTQVALSRERSAPALREVLQSNLEELERLRGIVADMLFLARAEQGERVRSRVQVSLAQEVRKIIDFFDMVLDESGMAVQVQGDAQLWAETSLLRRAVSNLLQNAIQHASGSPRIEVCIGQPEPGWAELSVANASPPLAQEQLEHVFDRFYRADHARTNSFESHGLGLAIVQAIARMHGGAAFVRQGEGQISFGLRLPADQKT